MTEKEIQLDWREQFDNSPLFAIPLDSGKEEIDNREARKSFIAEVEKLAEERGRLIEAKKWSEKTGKTLHEASKLVRSSLKAELIEKLEGSISTKITGGSFYTKKELLGIKEGYNQGISTAIDIIKSA